MTLTLEGEGRPFAGQTETANLTQTTDKGYSDKRIVKRLRLRRSAFNPNEAIIMPDLCACGDQKRDHDGQGCEICPCKRFVP